MKSIYQYILIMVITLVCVTDASAQNNDIHVGNDGPVIITLGEDAGSVIVGNPTNAYVILETPRRILVNAGAPGMTRLTVLNGNGKTILNRNLVIGAGGNGIIRIQNACINDDGGNCQPDITYNCGEGQRCNRTMPSAPPQSGGNSSYEIRTDRTSPPRDTRDIEEE
jgi:hypothetical protein